MYICIGLDVDLVMSYIRRERVPRQTDLQINSLVS